MEHRSLIVRIPSDIKPDSGLTASIELDPMLEKNTSPESAETLRLMVESVLNFWVTAERNPQFLPSNALTRSHLFSEFFHGMSHARAGLESEISSGRSRVYSTELPTDQQSTTS